MVHKKVLQIVKGYLMVVTTESSIVKDYLKGTKRGYLKE